MKLSVGQPWNGREMGKALLTAVSKIPWEDKGQQISYTYILLLCKALNYTSPTIVWIIIVLTLSYGLDYDCISSLHKMCIQHAWLCVPYFMDISFLPFPFLCLSKILDISEVCQAQVGNLSGASCLTWFT